MTTTAELKTELKGHKLGASIKAGWAMEAVRVECERVTEKAGMFDGRWIPLSMISGFAHNPECPAGVEAIVIPSWLARREFA